ncbi:GNAT family N-acetyltransferase [Arthrobacter sp. TWP1-1]|uniref:GNAT family N-acetyltransferase n=1 Tax=Arthrobacter sp. TWP1-1 TaxID=2804568 RepID=UPI003CF59E0E
MISIQLDDPDSADVQQLLDEHLADMRATSPAESVHALDHAALKKSEIAFWTVREGGVLLGCGALKHLGADQGEIKSMRTVPAARGRGIAASLLGQILAEARGRGYRKLYLETGSDEFFAPARRLYGRHGFAECEPFADYILDPYSVFMELKVDGGMPA